MSSDADPDVLRPPRRSRHGAQPCVLPVLPALLSAGGVGGRRRPLGIVLGLTVTFTVTIVGIAKVAGGVGLGRIRCATRRRRAARRSASRCSSRRSPSASSSRWPFLSRLGPRTRATASRRASSSAGRSASSTRRAPADPRCRDRGQRGHRPVGRVGLSYAVGSAIVLLALSLGGRRVIDRLRAAGRGPQVQRTLGRRDDPHRGRDRHAARRQARPADRRAHPAGQPDRVARVSHAVTSRIASSLHTHTLALHLDRRTGRQRRARRCRPPRPPPRCPTSGRRPNFVGTQRWFNTPGGTPADAGRAPRPASC